MAYREPYAGRQNPTYGDAPDYDPYYGAQAHPTYDQGGYDPYAGGYRDDPPLAAPHAGDRPKDEGFRHEEFEAPQARPRTPKSMRAWRYEHQGGQWAKGSRPRCIGRFCGCIVLVTLFLLISIVLALALWIRPPNITVGGVEQNSSGSTIQVQSDGVSINMGVNITVNNPNYFAVDFKQIKAEIFYPINNTAIGGGTEQNINFKSHEQTNFTFPFTIDYKTANDPSNKILLDLATKCGFIGGTKSDISVNYKITLGLRILFITVSPVVSNSMSFACPLKESDIAGFLGSSLAGLLSGS
ncbi:hypothetical protein PLICRDRAFT_175952 [Plicaturopsis crispa FD-325 SS-3]|nr:hypothetical protein PLICRDRAFT_175952 [Plicaturopsis crispa FD-325 SS-3]